MELCACSVAYDCWLNCGSVQLILIVGEIMCVFISSMWLSVELLEWSVVHNDCRWISVHVQKIILIVSGAMCLLVVHNDLHCVYSAVYNDSGSVLVFSS